MYCQRILCTVALTPLLCGMLFVASATEAQAQTDIIYFHSGHEVERMSWGRVTELTTDRIVYEHPSEDRTVRVDPWSIQWIQFGDDNLPGNWVGGLVNLRSGSFEQAVNDLEPFFNQSFRDEIRTEQRRAMVTWTTHYYLGRAYMGLGQTIERLGERVIAEMQDAQTNESVIYRDLRGRVDRQAQQMQRTAGRFLDSSFNDAYGELTELMRDNSDKSFFVSDEFQAQLRAVARAAATGTYNRAVDVLNHMFLSPPDSNIMSFRQSQSFWFFEMKLAKADALRGAGRFAEAAGEVTSQLISRLDGTTIPRRGDDPANPELVARLRVLSGRNHGFGHYLHRAYNLFAQICIDAGDYGGALDAYLRARTDFQNHPEFSQYFHEARLNYAFTLTFTRGFDAAQRELRGIIADVGFERFNRDSFEPQYALGAEQSRILAGAYIAMGDLALREFERTGSSTRRAEALESYLRVTAFCADDEYRARALFQAARLYRDIANEWESEWANRPAEDSDGRVVNPYHYYMQMYERLRAELQDLYGSSEWAQII